MRKYSMKKALAIGGIAMLMGAALAGCSSKDIKSKAGEEHAVTHDLSKLLEDNFGGLSHKVTEHSLETVCTEADKSKLKAGNLEEFSNGGMEGLVSDTISYQPLYEVEGYDDVYVAFVDMEPESLVDYAIYPEGTDAVEFDKESGVVFVPKELYGANEDGSSISPGIQLLIAVNAS